MPATPMRLLIAGLTTLSALPAAAQSDAGKTLRMVPHADLSVVDPQFIGVYRTANFARSLRWSTPGRSATTN
jgi:hypothetical protein